jgi:putative FmdB family regulatory protein
MPIYEYKCDKCGIVEVMQRITEDRLEKCPNCNGNVERIISHTSFVLKGSGWYATDYANKPKAEPGSESAPAATPASGDSTSNGASTESKTAAEKPKASTEKNTPKSPE